MRDMRTVFYSKITKDASGCWLWNGVLDKKGYGRIFVNRKRYFAHRLSWIVHNGEIPQGMYILHKCDNPTCVNPDHLFIGTQKDNVDDCIEKGRRKHVAESLCRIYGSKNGGARLTENDVIEIKKRLSVGEQQKRLAIEYGVGRATIWDIAHGKTWSNFIESGKSGDMGRV